MLRDGAFGEIHGGGRVRPGSPRVRDGPVAHKDRLEQIDPAAFDVLVVDEFHHAAADTYDRLLKRLSPRELSA